MVGGVGKGLGMGRLLSVALLALGMDCLSGWEEGPRLSNTGSAFTAIMEISCIIIYHARQHDGVSRIGDLVILNCLYIFGSRSSRRVLSEVSRRGKWKGVLMVVSTFIALDSSSASTIW